MRLRYFISNLLLLVFVVPYSAVAKVVSVAPTITYSGELNGKVPSGKGELIISNLLKKATIADTIRGNFSMTEEGYFEVSEAKATLSGDVRAAGKVCIRIQVLDKKLGHESVSYAVDGEIFRPTPNGVLEKLNGKFQLTRSIQAKEGVFSMGIAPFDMASVFRSTGKFYAFKVNGSDVQKPHGKGVFSTQTTPYFFAENTPLEVLSGQFDGQTVTDATLVFGNGIQYQGNVQYSIIDKAPEEVMFIYQMSSGKLLKDGKVLHEGVDTIICTRIMSIKEKDTTAQIISFLDWQRVDSVKLASAIQWGEYPYAMQKTKVLIRNGNIKYEPCTPASYILSDSTLCEINADTMTVEMPDGTFFKSIDGRIVELIRPYKEGLLHYVRGGESQIVYYDGSSYVGTLTIYAPKRRLFGIRAQTDVFIKAMSMNEFAVMYNNGVSTLSNGKQDIWKNGVTDYQKNKMAGNYERVTKVIASEMANEAKVVNQQWEAAKPQLIQEFGDYYVNILYNYQLVKGMPLSLFERVKEMKLPYFYLSFPMSVDKVGGAYVVSMRNRKTGEDQYSRVIKFNIIDRIYSISTDF